MPKDLPVALALIAALLSGLHCPLARCAEDWLGEWRVFRVQPAPWLAPNTLPPVALKPGDRLRLLAQGIDGPEPLACTRGAIEALDTPAEGLFHGALTLPAVQAQALGLPAGSRPGLRIDCSSGSWDFHAADPETLLFALDQRIYSLSRAPGAQAPAGSPAAAVQALLEHHFAGTRAFSREAWAPLHEGLCGGLAAAVDAYFEARWPEDEVPPVNGDPLSDSQEPPARFAVGETQSVGVQAEVAVRFADARREHTTTFLMQREQGAWRVCDLRYADGSHLSRVLSEQPR